MRPQGGREVPHIARDRGKRRRQSSVSVAREYTGDTLSPEERSERMSRIRGKDTKPELTIRRLVHGMGYRYRLHRNDLPGKPDMVFAGRRKVIFMHGCFWHRHPDPNCALARLPKSKLDFWRTKLEHNRERDLREQAQLRKLGWAYLIIWECQLRDLESVSARISEFLEGTNG